MRAEGIVCGGDVCGWTFVEGGVRGREGRRQGQAIIRLDGGMREVVWL